MNSFVCLSVWLDRKGGWGNKLLSGWLPFMLSIHSEPLFSGLSLLVDTGSMIVAVNLRPVSKLFEKSFLLENLQEEFVWVEGQILRSPPLLEMTTQGALEPENGLNGGLCCNFPPLNWHSLPEPRCILTNKYFSSLCFSDYASHSIQIKRQNVSLISTVMWDR